MRRFMVLSLAMCLVSTVAAYAANEEGQSSYPDLKVSGYIQSRYSVDKDSGNGFQVKRARGKFSGNISENIRYSLLFDLVDDKKGSNLADAYIDIVHLPQAKMRIGQFKTPFSMEYLTSSTKWDTIELAQVVSKLSSKRDVGVQLSGDISELLGYSVGIFNGTGSNVAEENKRKDFVLRGVVKPVKELLLGISHYEGWSGEEDENRTKRRTGAQLGYSNDLISIKGEFIFGKNSEISTYGWYAQAGHTLPVSPGRGSQKLQTIIKYDSYDPDRDKEEDKADIITVGLNWFITKNAKVQINNRIILDEEFHVDDNEVLAQIQVTW